MIVIRSSMPVFTKRIKNATSFIQAIEPLSRIVRSFVLTSLNASKMLHRSCEQQNRSFGDATSFVQKA